MPKFAPGQSVRFKPGQGTYGYEDDIEADGRVPGTVVDYGKSRVRVLLRLKRGTVRRGVAEDSLESA